MEEEKRKDPWDREDDVSCLEIYDMAEKRRRVVHRFGGLIEAPNWTPDGKALVYNSGGGLFRFDLAAAAVTPIDLGDIRSCNNDHVISPDGAQVAVSHHTREDGRSRIYVGSMAGGTPRLVTPMGPSYLHGWSPDGTTLSYCAERNGEYDIYTIPVQGGEERRLTDTPGLNDGSEFDPGGQYIWFNSVRSGLMQIYRMRRDGTEQVQMTFDPGWNAWFPHVSPDGALVSMLCYRKGDVEPWEHLPHQQVELRVMRADGSGIETVARLFGGQGTMNVNSWAPDSRRFAFVSYITRGGA